MLSMHSDSHPLMCFFSGAAWCTLITPPMHSPSTATANHSGEPFERRPRHRYPGDPQPSATQYAMIGEFGGIGAFVEGKEWKPKSCHTYLHVDTPAEEASTYVKMAATIASRVDHVSASVYTQTTDVELECDGFLNYDRSNKFSAADTEAIRKANQAIIDAASRDDT